MTERKPALGGGIPSRLRLSSQVGKARREKVPSNALPASICADLLSVVEGTLLSVANHRHRLLVAGRITLRLAFANAQPELITQEGAPPIP